MSTHAPRQTPGPRMLESLHIVVASSSQDARVRELAEALSRVVSDGDASATARPIAMPALTYPSDSLDGADVVIALDAASLERARTANIELCVAYWPGLGDAWDGSLASADLVLLSEASQRDIAIARGASASSLVVTGPLATEFATTSREDAERTLFKALPTEAEHERAVLVVATEALTGLELPKLLAQLALVSLPIVVLFDVGEDVERAKELRVLVPRFGVHAAIFSEPEVRALAYRAASRVFAPLDGVSSLRALASGTPLLALSRRAREQGVVEALTASKLLAFASLSTLSVTLDEALSVQATAAGRAAADALEPEKTPARIGEAIRHAYETHRRRGLPRGLEFLEMDPASVLSRELEPLTSAFVSRKQKEEAVIDAELEELKKRIRG